MEESYVIKQTGLSNHNEESTVKYNVPFLNGQYRHFDIETRARAQSECRLGTCGATRTRLIGSRAHTSHLG